MEEWLRITLVVRPAADPIVGRLYVDERHEHPFYGWLEFAAAIEAACGERSRAPEASGEAAARQPQAGDGQD